jgi:hypothetical protein
MRGCGKKNEEIKIYGDESGEKLNGCDQRRNLGILVGGGGRLFLMDG